MIEAAAEAESPDADRPRTAGRARIALAHDWLCGYRGGEAVLERLALLIERDFEPAGLYVMFDDGRRLSPTIDAWRERRLITASYLNRLPGGPTSLRRWLLPAYPSAVGQLGRTLARDHSRRPIDLVISSSSAAIKGLRPPPGVPHLCYCHSPARYVWSRMGDYSGRDAAGALRSLGLRAYAGRFRKWDRATASHVTRFIANSIHTAQLIKGVFARDAAVIHPPVRTDFFTPDPSIPRERFWLVVSALEPYKRIDLAIEAAQRAHARLVIAGSGSQRAALERLSGPSVEFRGRVSDEQLRDLYRRAALLIFPQVEDFGIVAAEALACGLPVVARAEGGALDIIQEGVTGALFRDSSPASIASAASRAPHNAPACRAGALRFSTAQFDAAAAREIAGLVTHNK